VWNIIYFKSLKYPLYPQIIFLNYNVIQISNFVQIWTPNIYTKNCVYLLIRFNGLSINYTYEKPGFKILNVQYLAIKIKHFIRF